MSPRLWALAAAFGALAAGFTAGAVAIGPVFSDEALKEAAAAQRAERFASRTVDLAKDYPEPFAYRTRTPVFPEGEPTGLAAAARAKALESYASAERRYDRQDERRADPFDMFSGDSRRRPSHSEFDRHTGVVY